MCGNVCAMEHWRGWNKLCNLQNLKCLLPGPLQKKEFAGPSLYSKIYPYFWGSPPSTCPHPIGIPEKSAVSPPTWLLHTARADRDRLGGGHSPCSLITITNEQVPGTQPVFNSQRGCCQVPWPHHSNPQMPVVRATCTVEASRPRAGPHLDQMALYLQASLFA